MPATTLSAVPQFSRLIGLSVDRSALKAVSLTQRLRQGRVVDQGGQ